MRLISTEPEFTWAGTLFIVIAFAVFGLGQSISWTARRRSWRRPGVTTARVAGAVLGLAIFGGAGSLMLPTVLFGGLAVWRTDWARLGRVLAGRVALPTIALVAAGLIDELGWGLRASPAWPGLSPFTASCSSPSVRPSRRTQTAGGCPVPFGSPSSSPGRSAGSSPPCRWSASDLVHLREQLTNQEQHMNITRIAAVAAVGAVVGSARFTEDGRGRVHVSVQVTGLAPGLRGIHVHESGACTPTFDAAGSHHNPLAQLHGAHAGDLPNLIVSRNGHGRLHATVDSFTLSAGPTGAFDADGSSLVVHALPDDRVTQPTGGSGARVVCGVIVRNQCRVRQHSRRCNHPGPGVRRHSSRPT
jgi:Cu-Zn family superoxide dismutase